MSDSQLLNWGVKTETLRIALYGRYTMEKKIEQDPVLSDSVWLRATEQVRSLRSQIPEKLRE